MASESTDKQKHGNLYFQKGYYTTSQMTHIADKFKNNLDQAPRVIFSDNYRDYQLRSHEKRMVKAGPQAKVLAPYDRSFGFAIPTRFVNANAFGFVNSDQNFNALILHLFNNLVKYLRNGCDVIIPAPLDTELTHKRNLEAQELNPWENKLIHSVSDF
eukprot:913813_1